jgi:hypothetical protein
MNDKYTAYYTSSIQENFPSYNLDTLEGNFVEGYREAVLNPERPFIPKSKSYAGSHVDMLEKMYIWLTLPVYFCVGVIAFLFNSTVQTARSFYRIRLYRKAQAESWVKMSGSGQAKECSVASQTAAADRVVDIACEVYDDSGPETIHDRRSKMSSHQRRMIKSLNSLEWRKYPVWIRKTKHTHAAIIARGDDPEFSEGYAVISHFTDKEFLI